MLRGIFKANPTTMVEDQQREIRLNSRGALVVAQEGTDGTAQGTTTNPTITQSAQQTYTLASNQTLAPAATTSAVSGIVGASYIFAYQFSGTTPSLVLEALGPDGVTYQTVTTVTASGTQGVVLGNNSTVRLRNAGANPITSLYASLS